MPIRGIREGKAYASGEIVRRLLGLCIVVPAEVASAGIAGASLLRPRADSVCEAGPSGADARTMGARATRVPASVRRAHHPRFLGETLEKIVVNRAVLPRRASAVGRAAIVQVRSS